MSDTLRQLPTNSVFICYRRVDSEEMVDRIYDTLVEKWGESAIFRDVDTIPPGVRFPTYITERLRDCLVVLVFIGRDWLSITDERGRRRLEDPDDYVRLEIETSFRIPNIRVIPVLVKRAEMPQRKDLPESLQSLCDFNGFSVRSSGPDYKQDIVRLTAAVGSAAADMVAARTNASRASDVGTPLSESDWDELFSAMAEDRIVPILGPDLMTFEVDGSAWSLPRWLAAQLAFRLKIPDPKIAECRPLEKSVQSAIEEGHSHPEVISQLRHILQHSGLVPSAAMLAVAALPWRLFITSALDNLLEAALLRVTGSAPLPLCFTPRRSNDLNGPMPVRPAMVVVHTAGALFGSSMDVALTAEDWRDFVVAWYRPELQPFRIFDELRSRRLLFVGGGHPPGFVPFLLHLYHRFVPRGRTRVAWIATSAIDTKADLDGLLDAEGPSHRLFADSTSQSLCNELTQRWSEWSRTQAEGSRVSVVSEPFSTLGNTITPGPLNLRGVNDMENPWPGLRPFTEADSAFFFGRDKEIAEILQRIQASPVTVLFAYSGTGKTSLLEAGLIPRLRRANWIPFLPKLQLDTEAPSLREQLLSAVVESDFFGNEKPMAPLSASSLWEFFHSRSTEAALKTSSTGGVVLILDQFEEFFTRADSRPTATSPTSSFLHEFAELCENRPPAALVAALDDGRADFTTFNFDAAFIRVAVSLREDYLAELLVWEREWPSLRRSLFRLEPLTGQQALEVLTAPSNSPFEITAAEQLVRSLADSRGGAMDEALATLTVPAPLLSMMASELNERRLRMGADKITSEMILALPAGYLLQSFYREAMVDVPPLVATWLEDFLITPSRHRNSVAEEVALQWFADHAMDPKWLEELVTRHILVRSMNAGVVWLSLVHDVLLPVVLEEREARIKRQAQEEAMEGSMRSAKQSPSRKGRWWAKLIGQS